MEIWKDIPGYPGYQASNLGKIKSLPKNDHLKKKILQFDLDGNFIKEWNSTKDVERTLGIKHSAISRVCKKRKYYNTAGGYIWRYKNDRDAN